MSVESARCNVAILAGGKGTRLRSRTGSLPKPMALIQGKPVLEHQINMCRRFGFKCIALLVHYEYCAISDYFGDGRDWGIELAYCVEQSARGTAGALRDALPFMDERFLVLYGDTYADVDLRAIWDDHIEYSAQATLFLHPNDHPADSDLVKIDQNGRVQAISPYPRAGGEMFGNLVNAALYVFERDGLDEIIQENGKSDIAKDTLPAMIAKDFLVRGYISPEYIKDMGTPDRLDKVEHDIIAGTTDRLSSRSPRRAVFLDRDGTINVEVGHLNHADQLQLLPGASEAVRAFNRAGLLAVGVTNQPVLARGDASWEDMERIHTRLDHELGLGNAYLDRLYLCPHHPEVGFEGEIHSLKIDCECRKPRTGMFDRAVRELNISRRDSWMIGDTTSDILAGRSSGLKTILVRTGHAGQDGKYSVEPDYIVPDLPAAAEWVLSGHPNMAMQLLGAASAAYNARLVLIGGLARSGKSSAARILAEHLAPSGRKIHVICLDGWLMPAQNRVEGVGILNRYDLAGFSSQMLPVFTSPQPILIRIPGYDRSTRSSISFYESSVGPEDLIIVEGVPALMMPHLFKITQVRIFIDSDEQVRRRRLMADYAWRGKTVDAIEATLGSRDLDETPHVLQSATNATHRITGN